MFRRKPPVFPDAERADLSRGHKIEWSAISGNLKRERRRRFVWRVLSDVAVMAVLGLAIWGLFTLIQHNAG